MRWVGGWQQQRGGRSFEPVKAVNYMSCMVEKCYYRAGSSEKHVFPSDCSLRLSGRLVMLHLYRSPKLPDTHRLPKALHIALWHAPDS